MGSVIIDNSSPHDNWITNETTIEVTVACEEMFGSFKIDLRPGESRRVTSDVKANVYPLGQYSYDDLRYHIGKSQNWEVRLDQGVLVMVNTASSSTIAPTPEQHNETRGEVHCANCGGLVDWDEAYKQQDTPGASEVNPPGTGDFRPRVFCPHCGFLVAEWDIDRNEDRDQWKWHGDNKTRNAGKELPPSPLTWWGKDVPLDGRVSISDEQLDVSQMMGRASTEEFLAAAASGDVATVQKQIVSGVDLNAKTYKGETAVMVAAMEGHTNVVHMLIEAGAAINDQNVYGRHTPLILAALQGHLDTVTVLIESGADKSLKNQFGKTAGEAADSAGHADIVELLTDRVVEPATPMQEDLIAEQSKEETRFSYAGFWKRFAAALIDLFIIFFTSTFIFVVCLNIFWGMSYYSSEAHDIIMFFFGWLYFAIFESSALQATPGKMALRTRVTDLEGRRVGFGKATGRFFGKIISFLVFLIGFIMVGFTQRKQGLHDKMSGCLVVNK